MTASGNVCTIVLNYYTWVYTKACVTSLLACRYPNHHIVMVDNASPNDSVAQLTTFLTSIGQLTAISDFQGCRLTTYRIDSTEITFLESALNGGYSAGNNVGLRYGLQRQETDYFWILNNDTTVHIDALQALVRQAASSTCDKLGLIGSVLLHHNKPGVVQAIGGRYLPYLGIAFPVGEGQTDLTKLSELRRQVNYIIGAACFMHRSFLEKVGLMSEAYFLYYEDTEWSYRARRLGYTNEVCLNSVVYHHDGGSTRQSSRISLLVEYYFARNKIRFSKRYFPFWLPTILLSALGACMQRLLTRNVKAAKLILRVTLQELTGRASDFPFTN